MVPTVRRYRFTVPEYARMAEAGVFHEDDRVELIHGDVVEMSPIGARHVAIVLRLTNFLARLVGADALVSVQNPILVGDDSAPQPDVVLLRWRSYDDGLPAVDDVVLMIEVADSSLGYDRGVKLPLYAVSGIAEAWLIDVAAGRIERHTEPKGDAYLRVATIGRGEELASTVLPSLALDASDVLGPPLGQ